MSLHREETASEKAEQKAEEDLYRSLEEGRSQEGFRRAILLLQVEPVRKAILLDRFVDLVAEYKDRVATVTCAYYGIHLFVKLSAILVPAVLGVQHYFPDSSFLYWFTWSLSLAVGVFTNVASAIGLDKKYFAWRKTLHALQAEGWQYVGQAGPYENRTHEASFADFTEAVEKLARKAKEEATAPKLEKK